MEALLRNHLAIDDGLAWSTEQTSRRDVRRMSMKTLVLFGILSKKEKPSHSYFHHM